MNTIEKIKGLIVTLAVSAFYWVDTVAALWLARLIMSWFIGGPVKFLQPWCMIVAAVAILPSTAMNIIAIFCGRKS